MARRLQNIELLRVVCMFFILIFHINLNVILRNDNASETLNYIAIFLNTIVVVAVNCYVLISGFFGINIKLKSIGKLLFQTEFYAILAIIIGCIFVGFSKGYITTLFPFKPSGLWFIPCYMTLYVLSPILNQIINIPRLHICSILSLLIVSFSMYFWGGDSGLSILQLILMYLIGAYIREKMTSINRHKEIIITIIGVLVTFAISVVWIYNGHPYSDKTIISYASPWVLLTSVSFFKLFLSLPDINCKIITTLSVSSLSVYLFHENSIVKEIVYIKPLRYLESLVQTDILFIFLIVLYAVMLYIIVVIIDKVRVSWQSYFIKSLEKYKLL